MVERNSKAKSSNDSMDLQAALDETVFFCCFFSSVHYLHEHAA